MITETTFDASVPHQSHAQRTAHHAHNHVHPGVRGSEGVCPRCVRVAVGVHAAARGHSLPLQVAVSFTSIHSSPMGFSFATSKPNKAARQKSPREASRMQCLCAVPLLVSY